MGGERTAAPAAPAWLGRLPHTDADLVAVISPDGRCLDVSPTAAGLLGIDRDELIDRPVCDPLAEGDRATVRALGVQVERTGQVRSTIRLHRRDGQPVWLDVAAKQVPATADHGDWVFVSARDVTDDVLALHHLAESEQRWRLAFEHSPIGAALVSTDGEIVLSNGSLAAMLGHRAEELSRLSLADVTHPDDRELDAAKRADLLAGTCSSYTVEKRYLTADGRMLWGQLTAAAVTDLDGDIRGVIVALQDITQRREAELELANRALHDPLTGLPNRFLVQQWLTSALSEHLGREVGVLFCDLDRFKVVNDSLGHAAGDDLIIEAAARLRAAVRPDDLVGRVGGDEFVVVCERLTGAEELLHIAGRLADALDEPISLSGHAHTVTASIGAAFGRAPDTGDELLMRADMALLRAKRMGRARVELFDGQIDHIATRDDLALEEQLRASVGAGQLRAYYQPIVTLPDGRLAGHEALMRWDHPEHGLLAPSRFMQIAETTGLIRSLGWWMLGRACRDAAVQLGGVGAAGTWVAVNASPNQLTRPGVYDVVADVLRSSGLAPSQLHLEITETALMQASAPLVEELERLRGLGVAIVLDDFGTGFSSLSLLRDFPVSTVKIDKSFVEPLLVDPSASAIVRAVIGMCHDLGLETVAEGVESTAQAERLAALGCSHAQGFLFGRPQDVAGAQPEEFGSIMNRLYPHGPGRTGTTHGADRAPGEGRAVSG